MVMSAHVPTHAFPSLPVTLETDLATSLDERERASAPIARHIGRTAALQATMVPLLELVQRIGDNPTEEDFESVKRVFAVFLDDVGRWYAEYPKGDGESALRKS